jgi:hypothetical protein
VGFSAAYEDGRRHIMGSYILGGRNYLKITTFLLIFIVIEDT